ncbi:MAG TPA: MAE_28990/MAE_18760 family HEPN-like nuclease [Caldilineaceae bacterium]|nr:MAE_28990/MAE_18760 family HEPN-like nuclease [Caldilineaceae bacterium]
MKASQSAFLQNLESLKHYLQALDLESDLLGQRTTSSNPSEIEKSFHKFKEHLTSSAGKRRFDYNSIIVSLYGFFEQYVEALLRSYIIAINGIVPKYELLPEQIIKRHLELSYTLITRIEQTQYKSEITSQEIIANLYSCLINLGNYKINSDAFAYHSANFRTGVIESTFAGLGIQHVSKKIKEDETFIEYLKAINPVRNLESMSIQEMFAIIDDLAERRNDVAHGVNSDILSNQILYDYITFFHAYGVALYNVTRRETLQYIAKYQAVEIGRAIKVINNSIVCLTLKNLAIKKGDTLIAKTPNNLYYDGEIEEIQVDGVSYAELEPCSSIDVGIKIAFKAKDNQSFLLLPQ